MKNLFRTMMSIFIIISIILIPIDVSALSIENTNNSDSAILELLADCGNTNSVRFKKPLYNSNEEIIANLYFLNPNGYAVVSLQDVIIEFSLTQDFCSQTTSRLYYTGPMSFYIKEGGKYFDLKTDAEISKPTIDKCELELNQKIELSNSVTQYQTSSVSPRAEIIDSDYTISYVPTAYQSTNNTCGPIACAIFLKYYDDHINSNILNAVHNTSSGTALMNYFQNLIDVNEDGCSYVDVVNGLNYHMSNRGLTTYNATSAIDCAFSLYKTTVERNRPTIVGVTGHAVYGEHWVVGYGYFISNPATYVIVNDGWGSNGIRINYNFTDGMVYLNK